MLPAMANTLARSRSLAWWMAAERFTVLRLAIVPKPMAISEVSPSEMTTSSRLDRPGVGHHLGEDRLHALPLRSRRPS